MFCIDTQFQPFAVFMDFAKESWIVEKQSQFYFSCILGLTAYKYKLYLTSYNMTLMQAFTIKYQINYFYTFENRLKFIIIVKQSFRKMGNDCNNPCQNYAFDSDRRAKFNYGLELLTHQSEDINQPPIRPSMTKDFATPLSQQTNFTYSRLSGNGNIQKRPPMQFSNQVIYDGQWKGNVKEGYGIQTWPDGSKYEGQWRNNKASGRGKFIHADGDIYDGQWLNDKAHGHGRYYQQNGIIYQGNWQNDLQHGYGVSTWTDGNKYQGYFFEGKKHGKGKYQWKDGSVYDGQWKNDKINGYGIHTWSDGRKYEGNWENNQFNKYGSFLEKQGNRYQGTYLNNKKHGIGEYTWKDGRKFIGNWIHEKRQGKGKMIYPDGTTRVGYWQNDKRIYWQDDQNSHNNKRDSKISNNLLPS